MERKRLDPPTRTKTKPDRSYEANRARLSRAIRTVNLIDASCLTRRPFVPGGAS